jgi:hypothetical protein
MLEMLRAHGLDAGPTQRPLHAGAIAGLLADVPAVLLLHQFGTLAAIAEAFGFALPVVALLHAAAMVLAGIGYGLLFRRGANDVAGGWLFGMSYGFLVWMLVAVPLLQWLPPQPLIVALPAIGLFAGQLAWGLVLGAAFKFVHRPLQSGIDGQLAGLAEKAGSR